VTYYVRAYAVTATGATYGEQRNFTTGDKLPAVTTAEISGITDVSATAGGNITDAGSKPITEAGVYWGTDPNPTEANNKLAAEQTGGTFSVTIEGLAPSTTYYVRAYATSGAGTAIGEERSFTTADQPALSLPFVERFTGTDEEHFPPTYWQLIDHDGDGRNWYAYYSRFYGAMSDSEDDGSVSIEPYNFLISPKIRISGTKPTLDWNIGYASTGSFFAEHYKVVVATTAFTAENCETNGDIVFEETLPQLESRTLSPRSVDLTAYADKDVYVAWVHYNTVDKVALLVSDIRIGSTENPATVTAPTVGTLSVGDITPVSAAATAIITNDGGVSVTGRGFCYSKSANPTIENATVIDVTATASNVLTSFSEKLGLEIETKYYIRAYAINAAGITYSNEVTFETLPAVSLLSEKFETEPFDRGWTIIDKDEDGYNWEWFGGAMTSDSWRSGGVGALTPENYLISPSLAIPADAEQVKVIFQIAAADDSDFEEAYKVIVSENEINFDNCRDAGVLQDWTTLTEEYSDETFVEVSIDLTAYKGKTVYLGFVHGNCTNQYYILFRNLNVIYF
ncbi:MAG: choice-of-anchor J domain-containing protein, partial [Tannerella sp.]|nr:choice-of-anchor J domain-containing protein [Tannerella sp.]